MHGVFLEMLSYFNVNHDDVSFSKQIVRVLELLVHVNKKGKYELFVTSDL